MVGLRVSGVAAVQGIYQKNVQDQITVGTDFYFIYFVLRGVGTEGHISDLGGYHFFMKYYDANKHDPATFFQKMEMSVSPPIN